MENNLVLTMHSIILLMAFDDKQAFQVYCQTVRRFQRRYLSFIGGPQDYTGNMKCIKAAYNMFFMKTPYLNKTTAFVFLHCPKM